LLQALSNWQPTNQSQSLYFSACCPAEAFCNDFHRHYGYLSGVPAAPGRILRLGLKNPALIDRLAQLRQHTITKGNETAGILRTWQVVGASMSDLSAIVANRIKNSVRHKRPDDSFDERSWKSSND
jgi:hypothetical protein